MLAEPFCWRMAGIVVMTVAVLFSPVVYGKDLAILAFCADRCAGVSCSHRQCQ